MITYNHEKFIEKALVSVFEQLYDGTIELVISNDCSTDRTDSIIRRIIHERNYKKIINFKYLNQKKNVGVGKNFKLALESCSGKYIAILEGDDYWNDVNKLQKQVDFLEKNEEYVISGHNAFILQNDKLGSLKLQDGLQYDASAFEVKQGYYILTLTSLFRNKLADIDLNFQDYINCDTILFSKLGVYGKFHFHKDIEPAIYRQHGGGIWSLKSDFYKFYQSSRSFLHLRDFHNKRSDKIVSDKLFSLFLYWRIRYYRILIGQNKINKIGSLLIKDFFIFSMRRKIKSYISLLGKLIRIYLN